MALKSSERNILGVRYAKALFLIAKEKGELDDVNKQLHEVNELFSKNESLAKTLANPSLGFQDLKNVIIEISDKAKVGDVTKNFLLSLCKNKRMSITPQITESFSAMYMNERNEVNAEVISAKKLDKKTLDSISDKLSKNVNKKVICKNYIKSDLIGGLQIKLESKLFDDSIKGKLERLKTGLVSA